VELWLRADVAGWAGIHRGAAEWDGTRKLIMAARKCSKTAAVHRRGSGWTITPPGVAPCRSICDL